jgi:hypothetical protein
MLRHKNHVGIGLADYLEITERAVGFGQGPSRSQLGVLPLLFNLKQLTRKRFSTSFLTYNVQRAEIRQTLGEVVGKNCLPVVQVLHQGVGKDVEPKQLLEIERARLHPPGESSGEG